MSRYLLLKKDDDGDEYPWLMNEAIAEFDQDPLGPIKEVHEHLKKLTDGEEFPNYFIAKKWERMWAAIEETVKMWEGEK